MLSPIKKYTPSRTNPDERFVSLDAISIRSKEILSKFKDSTLLYPELHQQLKNEVSSYEDLKVLIQHLEKTKQVKTFELTTLAGERLEVVKVILFSN